MTSILWSCLSLVTNLTWHLCKCASYADFTTYIHHVSNKCANYFFAVLFKNKPMSIKIGRSGTNTHQNCIKCPFYLKYVPTLPWELWIDRLNAFGTFFETRCMIVLWSLCELCYQLNISMWYGIREVFIARMVCKCTVYHRA